MGCRVSQLVFDGESLITPEAIANAFASSVSRRHGEEFETGKAELAVILGIAQQQFREGRDPAAIVHRANAALHKLRDKSHPAVWQAMIPVAQNHPVSEFFHQDPFVRWSFEKPRGYSGDAHLLDFIYGHPSVAKELASASSVGNALYGYTYYAPSAAAVRERRDLLAMHVDGIAAARGPEMEILAIAGGHLREASRSTALKKGQIKRWVALDQDPLSVGSITRDFAGMPVEAMDGSVRGLLTNAYKLGRFDFVYAAGLYDYLPHKVAVRLTQSCLQLLKPDGIFLFANFSPEMTDDGFLETFMNWALLQRSEEDMWAIINASVDRNSVEASVYFGSNRNIVYAVLRKRQEIRLAPVPAIPDWTERFEAVMEPMDGWLVWDNLMDLPAEQAGLELFGLSHPEALTHCRRLNRAWPLHRSMPLS
jgi:SAM-dependent methyltransferase